jgi:type I restriction enzyme S subunit
VREGWAVKQLGEVLRLEYGKPLDKSDRNPDGKYPAYGANGEKDRTDKSLCDTPSIVVGRKGSAGEITLTEDRFWPLDVTYYAEFNRQKYDLRFIYYLLITLNLPDLAKGVKPGINRNEVYALSTLVPPLPEQRRIVAILDEAFEGIATAKANAEKNLQNAREVFEGHLNAVFSQRGEGWVDRRLGDVAMEFGRGKSKHRPRNDPKLYGGNFPFIQTGDVRNSSHLITSYDQTYNDAGLAQSKLWPKGTLCITIAANIAETGILDFDACFPDSIIGLVANEKISTNKYIEYLLTSFKSRLQLLGKGSAQDNINLATFENQYFPFPPLSDQKLIISTLDDLHEETQHLESLYQQKLTAIDELKQSLLHQAFNGDL